MTTKFDTIGWATKKEANGAFSWTVTGRTYGQAKRVCLWHRKNSSK